MLLNILYKFLYKLLFKSLYTFLYRFIFVRFICAVFLALIIYSVYSFYNTYSPKSNFPQFPVNNSPVIEALPIELIIPEIGINNKIIPVGITSSGNLDVPISLKNVGWYEQGVKPGNIGNAVIDGHQVDTLGMSAVFKKLNLLKIGDVIYVKTRNYNSEDNSKEEILKFAVTDLEVYNYDQAPLNKIFGDSLTANLNLITCEGEFIQKLQTKNKRLVVYSTRIYDKNI